MNFGSEIKQLRQSRQLTQEQLAKELDIDAPYLSKIENGKNTSLSEEFIRKIAVFFEVNPIDLTYLAGLIPSEHKDIIISSPMLQRDLKIKFRDVTTAQKHSGQINKTAFYSIEMIESIASKILLRWCQRNNLPMVTPPIGIEEIIKSLYKDEITIIPITDKTNNFPDFAMAGISEGGHLFINMRDFDNRLKHEGTKRFTLAHELGHWELHFPNKDKKDQVKFNLFETSSNEPLFKCRKEDIENSPMDWDEINANRFAAAILMPENLIQLVWQNQIHQKISDKEELIKKLSNIFEVSKRAMEIRLKNLKLLDTLK